MKSQSGPNLLGAATGVTMLTIAGVLGYLGREASASEILDQSRQDRMANEIRPNCTEDFNLATYEETIKILNRIQGDFGNPIQLAVLNNPELTGIEGEYVLMLISSEKRITALPLAGITDLPAEITKFCVEG